PEMRRFNQEIIPGIAEQFAGMGSGSLSSSGFRNSAVNAGADLSERLGAIRAQLRQQAAQGLSNIGQLGLGNYNQNVYTQGQPRLFESLGPAFGSIGSSLAGPLLGRAGNVLGDKFFKPSDQAAKGQSSPYGGGNVYR